MYFSRFFMVLLICLAMVAAALAPHDRCLAADTKIGMVNLKEVYTRSDKIKRLSEDLKKFSLNAQNRINKIQADLEELQKKLAADDLKGDEKTKLQNEIAVAKEKLAQEKHEFSVKISFRRKSLQNSVRIQVEQITRSLAEKKGLQGVIAEAAVVYAGSMPDITAEVIKALDESDKKSGQAEPKADAGKEKAKDPK
jgi:Skp family chaperone for outer membrane proteins